MKVFKSTQKESAVLSTDPKTAKRRLSNIRPREVSLVDSPANGREFLLIKRKDAMNLKEKALYKNEAGGNGGQPETPTTTAPVTPKPVTPPIVETKPPETPVAKSFQDQATEVLDGVSVTKALHMESKEMFLAMASALQSMGGAMDLIKTDLQTFIESEGNSGFGGKAIAKAEGLEDGISDGTFTTLLDVVEKKGRRMKGARLAKLKSLVGGLTQLLSELEGEAPTTKTVTPPAKPGEAPEVSEISKAVVKALEPLEKRLNKLEGAPVAPAGQEPDGGTPPEDGKNKSVFKGVLNRTTKKE